MTDGTLNLLSAEELARALGVKSVRTLRVYEEKFRLPFVRIHPRAPHRYPLDQVQAWLQDFLFNGRHIEAAEMKSLAEQVDESAARRDVQRWVEESMGVRSKPQNARRAG